jgi:hypothetical protein
MAQSSDVRGVCLCRSASVLAGVEARVPSTRAKTAARHRPRATVHSGPEKGRAISGSGHSGSAVRATDARCVPVDVPVADPTFFQSPEVHPRPTRAMCAGSFDFGAIILCVWPTCTCNRNRHKNRACGATRPTYLPQHVARARVRGTVRQASNMEWHYDTLRPNASKTGFWERHHAIPRRKLPL